MASNQDASLGYAPEATYGTFVAPIRHLEFVDESFDLTKEIKQGLGLRVGARVARSSRRVAVARSAAGSVKIEAASRGLGLWWQNLLGAGTSTMVSGTTYQQVFTLADVMPMFSMQRGLPRVDGTIACHSFVGCTVKDFEIDFPNKDLVTVNANVDSRNLDTTQTYTSPVYPANPTLFSFAGATFTTGALTAPTTTALASAPTPIGMVRAGNVKVDHQITVDRSNGGNGGLKSRQMPGLRKITGKLTVEHDNTFDFVAAINNETPMNLILTWVTTTALSVGFETLQVVVPEIKLDSALPNSNGTDLIVHDITFEGLDNQTAAQPIWIVTRTADIAL